jgi:hypothetical protein
MAIHSPPTQTHAQLTGDLPQCAIRYSLGSGRYTDRAARQIAGFFEQISSAGHNQGSVVMALRDAYTKV